MFSCLECFVYNLSYLGYFRIFEKRGMKSARHVNENVAFREEKLKWGGGTWKGREGKVKAGLMGLTKLKDVE